jgi:hypothetical protein
MNTVSKLKYTGKLVDEGIIDARLAAGVIQEIDELLRFYIYLELPSLQKQNLEIPVKINKGSWEVEVLDLIIKNLDKGVLAIVATTYAKGLAEKSATDGFFESGLSKDIQKVFKGANKALYWVIKIAKHLGGLDKKDIPTGKFSKDNTYIEIANADNMMLNVPVKQLDNFKNTNKKAFNNIAKTIEKERSLKYEIYEDGVTKSVEINHLEKSFFYFEDENEILLPELVHGKHVRITGRITRLNDRSGTLGLEYQDHILTITPVKPKNIKQFKDELISEDTGKIFPIVEVVGVVDRMDTNMDIKTKKPMIVFSEITKLDEDIRRDNITLLD